jgi:cysteine desulfurase
MTSIYLDYNATTPIDPAVREAMLPYLGECFGNPSSSHAQGRVCAEAIDRAREQVAEMLGASASEIVFTAGGTESNNLAILGTMTREAPSTGRHLVTSSIEHPATIAPAEFLERQGYAISMVGCDGTGTIAPADVREALRPETALASIIHANNEIGSIQPIRAIAEVCHAQGALVHTDAAQSIGKVPVRVDDLNVDLLSIAGHKLYAPKGVGALYVRGGTRLEPVLHGAGQERGFRPGTENVAYIVGLGVAAELITNQLATAAQHMRAMRDRLHATLAAAIGERLLVNGANTELLPNTLSVSFPDVSGHELLQRTPDVLASTGAACHSGETRLSATLAAIGLDEPTARGTVRLSVGRHTTAAEIDRAADLLLAAWRELTTATG